MNVYFADTNNCRIAWILLFILIALPIQAYPDSELPSDVNPLPSEPDLEQLLSIVRSIPENGWGRVNENQFQDVWTPTGLRVLYNGSAPLSPYPIINAWSSFAWDSRRGDLIIYGGGHANYGGNDVYRWRGTTLNWERMSLPSDMVHDGTYWVAIDGPDAAPLSAHTYDNNIYLPIVDRFLTFGGAAYQHGGSYKLQEPDGTYRPTGPYFFDPALADGNKVGGTTGSHPQWDGLYLGVIGGEMWENRDTPGNIPGSIVPRTFAEGTTGYTQEDGKDIVFVSAQKGYAAALFKYTINDVTDPTQDLWELVGRYRNGIAGQGAGAYLPELDIYVRTGSPYPFGYWNLATAGSLNNDILFSPYNPDGKFKFSTHYGMDYDPVRNRLLLWKDGGDVWALYPPAVVSSAGWTIEKLETSIVPTEIPSLDPKDAGVLGKWKYIAQLDAFIALQNAATGNIWIYKPEGWTEPSSRDGPSVTITTPTSEGFIIPGDDIVVTAIAEAREGTIEQVEFLLGGEVMATLTNPPYTTEVISAARGVYTFEAIATDNSGLSSISPRVSVVVEHPTNNPPLVTMSAPLDESIFVSGRTITLSADASDADGSVVRVEFFQNGSSLGVDTTAPYAVTWANVHEGTHTLTAAATDDSEITTTSAIVTISVTPPGELLVLQNGLDGYAGTADTHLNTYFASVPFGGQTGLLSKKDRYSPLVRFAVFASEGGPVPDGALITFATLALYKSSAYNYTYRAHPMLIDWIEGEATWERAAVGRPWHEPGAAGSDTDYAATGSANVYVGWNPGWLEFDVTDNLQAMSLGQQANSGWRLFSVSGNYNAKSFYSREYSGNPELRPKLVLHYQLDPNANVRPAVALTAPVGGSAHNSGDPITLSADASDTDGSVAQVEFFSNGASLGVDSSAPYGFTWNEAPQGTHTLSAVATDDVGAATTSATVTISVVDGNVNDMVVLQDGLSGYAGTADAHMNSYFTTTPFGGQTSFLSKMGRYNPLVRFAVFASEGGPVPNGALITSATLAMYKSSAYNYTYRAHPMLTEWSESEATWMRAAVGRPWNEPGAAGSDTDYAATGSANVYVGWNPGWLELDVTDSLQAMSLGQQANNGWQLLAVSGNYNAKSFRSREYSDDPTLRPKLVIHYEAVQ